MSGIFLKRAQQTKTNERPLLPCLVTTHTHSFIISVSRRFDGDMDNIFFALDGKWSPWPGRGGGVCLESWCASRKKKSGECIGQQSGMSSTSPHLRQTASLLPTHNAPAGKFRRPTPSPGNETSWRGRRLRPYTPYTHCF